LKKIIILFSIIVILSVVCFFLPNIWTTSPFLPHTTNLIVGGEVIKDIDPPIVENGQILLSLPIIKQYIDPSVHWDKKVGKIIFTTRQKVVSMKTDKLTAMVNSNPVDLNIPTRLINDTPYIPIQFLSEILEMQIEYIEKNNVVILDKQTSAIYKAVTIVENADIRKSPSLRSKIVSKNLTQNQSMRVFGESKTWYNVRTKEGIVGYIEKKYVEKTSEDIKITKPEKNQFPQWKPENGKINMVWEYVYMKTPNMSKTKKIHSLDVVSPTWFTVIDDEGTVENKADPEYIKWAHGNGYKVWGLISNNFDKDITHEVLNNADKREKVIQQILIYSKLYKLDGINIDFENVYYTDKDMLTQLIRELCPLLREQGLIISIDVTMKSSSELWSKFYDRKALADLVDYVALMAYDQHWGSSPVAGSVAQYNWVERGLVSILEEVPNEKLLLGLPFYTRLWKEEKIDGETKVSSTAITMPKANEIIKNKKLNLVWDNQSGQYYAHYMEDKITYKIWFEDKKSINLKSSLIHKYNLAGAASWRRGFETEEIWTTLSDSLKNTKNYIQWANANKSEYIID